MAPRIAGAYLLLAAVVISACAVTEPLVPKSSDVPEGLNLSGQWTLLKDARADTREPLSDEVRVDVFLRVGKSLKLTQTEHGLFVSFDRSIVEEYRFGENRRVNIGPVGADRVSGWHNGAYVIETRDEEGATLIESYRLGNDGESLTRQVSIVNGRQTEFELLQAFERH